METKNFTVEVVSRERAVYQVAAKDAAGAERLAKQRWQRNEPGDVPGFDWCELDSVSVRATPASVRDRQDDELMLRFIQEREHLLAKLGDAWRDIAVSDAISAAQAATDLGWYAPSRGHGSSASPDVARAGAALERLCQRKRLVCFERPRVREGERGEVRLYCTPGYLEMLAETLSGAMPRLVS